MRTVQTEIIVSKIKGRWSAKGSSKFREGGMPVREFLKKQLGPAVFQQTFVEIVFVTRWHTLRIGCTELKAVPHAGLGFHFLEYQ